MLVRVQTGAGPGRQGLSSAEERVHAMLVGWAAGTEYHMPGLAMLNVHLPDKHTTRQVDGLLFLPTGLVVLEVKGFTRAQSGKLVIPPNGSWYVGDEPAAIHMLAGAPNPGDQVRGGVYAAKNAFAGITGGGDAYIRGLVVLVSSGEIDVPPGADIAGRGIDVAVDRQRSLRRVMHRYGRSPLVWSADGVLAACRSIGLAEHLPGRGELLAEGFPETIAAPPPPRPGRALRSRPQPLIARLQHPQPKRTTTRPHTLTPAKPPPETPQPRSVPVPQPRRPEVHVPRTPDSSGVPRLPWALIVGLLVLAALGVVAALVVHDLFHG